MKKVIIIIAAILMALVLLFGVVKLCLFGLSIKSDISSLKYYFKAHTNYVGTTGEYADKTEKLLEEKYGEKFKVVQYGDNQATVYPESNPNLLFTARRYAVSDLVDDDYIQEIVGLQYKKLAEDVLKDFKYDYYLDVDLPFTYDSIDADQNVTIEEFKKVFPKKVEPHYYLYVSDAILDLSNQELYDWINKVAAIPEQDNALVRMFFVDDDQMILVKQHYENYSYRTGQFQTDTSGILSVQQHVEDNKFVIDYNRFNEIMNGE